MNSFRSALVRSSVQKFSRARLRPPVAWRYGYRTLRLTPEGVRFLVLTVALGVAAINTGNNLLYLLLAMMLSLIVVSGVLSEKCLRGLAIIFRIAPHVFAGHATTVMLRMTNEKPHFPSFSLKITEIISGANTVLPAQILHLPPHATVSQSYQLLFPRRGSYKIKGIRLSTRFPFGLFQKAAILPVSTEVVAYPNPHPLPESVVRDLKSMGHDRETPRRGIGTGLYNLRDYQVGDDSRSVHWKTSARHSRLIVKETEAEDHRTVTLALPTSAPDQTLGDRFETAVGLVAALAAYFYGEGFAIRLLVGPQEVAYGTGEAHFYHMLRMLALCQISTAAPIPSSFLTLADKTAMGELTVLVLPWEDAELRSVCDGASRILEAWAS